MTITISLVDIGYFVLFLLLAVVLVYAGIAFYRLAQILKRVDVFLEKNSTNLDRTVGTIPEILDNVNGTSEIVLQAVDKADMAIDSIGASVSETAASLRQGAAGVTGYVHAIVEIIQAVRGIISGLKK